MSNRRNKEVKHHTVHRLGYPWRETDVGGVSKGWRVKKPEEAIKCSLIKEPIIFIEPMPKHKIELLMTKYSYQEWLGYLVGRRSEKENYFVEDLVIPPHREVSAASAEAEPFHIPDNCVGVIHSHHSMGAFHSGTDEDYVDKNFPVSITVSKSGQTLEFDAVSHQTTLCGRKTSSKCTIKYVSPKPQFDTEAFMEEAVANIDEGRRTVTTLAATPYRYVGEDFYTTKDGVVISQTELDLHLRKIYGEDKLIGYE